MPKHKYPSHPFETGSGETAVLAGHRDGLSRGHRTIIENNWRYFQRGREHEETKILSPGFLQEETDWQADASCKEADPKLFFPEDNEAKLRGAWKSYCESCPVSQACKAYAERHDLMGIWGGVPVNMNLATQGRARVFHEPGSAAARKQMRDRARHAKVKING